MINFLIDENLPRQVGEIFRGRGFAVEQVSENFELRQKSDEVIFDYAVKKQSIIVTRDLNFANPVRFSLNKVPGMVIIRFPNEVSISKLSHEVNRLISDLGENDFLNLIVLEPGSVRKRKL